MQRTNEMYERAKKKSVGTYSKVAYNRRRKKQMKKFVLRSAAITIALVAALKIVPAAYGKIEYAMDVKEATTHQAVEASELLNKYDLNVVPREDGNWHNNYNVIDSLSEDDLFGFYNYFGYSESEKVVQALGYDSWNNYLSMKGYFNQDGRPSIVVWQNYEEARIVEAEKGDKLNGRSH